MTTQTMEAPRTKPGRPGRVPRLVMKTANAVVSGLLRSPLHGLLSGTVLLITFTGRKSGQRFTTPVTYLRDGEQLLVFTPAPWWKNLRGGAPVRLRLQGRALAARATPVEDEDTVAEGIHLFLQRKGLGNAGQIGLKVDPTHAPTFEELRRLAAGRVLVRLAPAGSL